MYISVCVYILNVYLRYFLCDIKKTIAMVIDALVLVPHISRPAPSWVIHPHLKPCDMILPLAGAAATTLLRSTVRILNWFPEGNMICGSAYSIKLTTREKWLSFVALTRYFSSIPFSYSGA